MGFGGSITLLVIGAILAFGVQDRISGVDLSVIGYIFMGAGVLWLILTFAMASQRTHTSHREVIERHDDTTPPVV
jgi:Domain of unknown function (DUF6458)